MGRRRAMSWSVKIKWQISVWTVQLIKVHHQRWFRIFWSNWTEVDLSIWLLSKISRIFGMMESTLEVSCPLILNLYMNCLPRFWYLTLDQSCMCGMDSSHCQAKESLPLHWRSNSMENHLNHMAKIMIQFFPMVNLTAAMTKLTIKFHLEDHHGHCSQDSMKRQRRYCSVRNSLTGQIQPRLSEWKDILVLLNWHLRYVQ